MAPFPRGVMLPNGHNTDPPLPADHPTVGFKLNHVCLRVRDPEKSLSFYINLMGMRTVSVFNTGPVTFYFLGHPSTDRHRENLGDYGKETPIPDTMGLLELWHVHGSERQPEGFYGSGNTPPNLGFCHLGFSVPDLSSTLKRLRENGVPIIKDIGVATRQSIPITDWENEHGVGVEVEGTDSEIHPTFKQIFANFAYIQDPVSCAQHRPNLITKVSLIGV